MMTDKPSYWTDEMWMEYVEAESKRRGTWFLWFWIALPLAISMALLLGTAITWLVSQ